MRYVVRAAFGQMRKFTLPILPTFKGPFHSETFRIAKTCLSARADLEPVVQLGRQCAGHLPFRSKSL